MKFRAATIAISAFALAPCSAAASETVHGDHFTVEMPGSPVPQGSKVRLTAGTVEKKNWTLTDGDVVYSVATTDYPAALVKANSEARYLGQARDELVGQLKGTVRSEKDILVHGAKGREFVISSGGGELKARSVMAGPRVYTLMVFNPLGGVPGDADRFLQSLTFSH